MEYLNEEQIKRAKNCIYNIQDKLNAIENELSKEKPYKYYMNEKLTSIKWDMNCLISMCEEE